LVLKVIEMFMILFINGLELDYEQNFLIKLFFCKNINFSYFFFINFHIYKTCDLFNSSWLDSLVFFTKIRFNRFLKNAARRVKYIKRKKKSKEKNILIIIFYYFNFFVYLFEDESIAKNFSFPGLYYYKYRKI